MLKGDDISRHIISIDKFTDVGSVGGVGEISSAQIMLNSDFGRFLNVAPAVDQFNEFDISVTSPYDANETYRRLMILDEIMPQTEEGAGYATTVQLYGREWWLTKVKMTGHYFFITFRDMLKEIIDVYNSKKKDAPEIVLEMDEVPPYTAGIFRFGYETSCYKALLAVQARLRLPVSGGGAGEFFEMRFTDDVNNDGDSIVKCDVFPYGGRRKNPLITRLNGKDIDTQYISETKQNVKGTVVVARGQADAGRYPKEIALWSNYLEAFANAPAWNPDITYVKGSLVFFKDKAWEAIVEGAGSEEPGTANVEWKEAARPFLNNFDYSPWTTNNAIHYKNLASTAEGIPDSEKPRRMGFPDSNLVVKDGANYRNFADFRVRREDGIPSDFRYPDGAIPEDMRVLVDPSLGNLAGEFAKNHGAGAGRDKFGNPYKHSIAQYRGGEWIVIHNSKLYDESTILNESRVYVFGKDVRIGGRDDRLSYRRTLQKETGSLLNPRDPTDTENFKWIPMNKHYLGHDCFHQATSVDHDVENLHEELKNKNLVNPEVLGDMISLNPSAVKIEYNFRNKNLDEGNVLYSRGIFRAQDTTPGGSGAWLRQTMVDFVRGATAADFFIKDSAYQYGWWGTLFQAPFPRKRTSGNEVGSIFKPPVLDLKNLNYTSSGKQGWGHEDSDNLGQITGLHFLFKFQYTIATDTNNVPFVGDLPFRVTMYDTEDNVWTADFTYRFLGDVQQVILPISAFRVYRARNPAALSVDDIIQNILTPDLKVLEIFETRKIKMITLQWQASYDSAGRYSPFNANRYFLNIGAELFGKTPRFTGWFDAVGFIKAPIAQAIRKPEPEGGTMNVGDDIPYHIMPDIKDYPGVTSQLQLEKIAQAELDLAEFRFDDYVIKTTGRCDLRAGDAVIVHDDDIITDTYHPGVGPESLTEDHTKRLSVRKINYTVNASDGPSGFVRHVTVQDRIGNPEVKQG